MKLDEFNEIIKNNVLYKMMFIYNLFMFILGGAKIPDMLPYILSIEIFCLSSFLL